MPDSNLGAESVVVGEEEYKRAYGFNDTFEYKFKTKKGISEDVVREISAMKGEPEWMLEKRLVGYKQFISKPTPQWGGNLNDIDYNDIYYYLKPTDKKGNTWESVPKEIKDTFDKLGIPEAERKFFAGAEAQYDSEVVYSHIREDLAKDGVIFTSTDEAVKKYPELMKKYFGTVIPPTDNKFAALNTAVWSGGSFIYLPKGVKMKMPLQAYFRINAEKAGQFERTLIIAEEGADVTYIEGCFVAGTKVITKNGEINIEDINVGEEVLTHDGTYKRVYHTQVRPHTGALYVITYFGDSTCTIQTTDEHPFLVSKRSREEYKNTNWSTEWVKAKDLRRHDYIAIPIDRTVKSNNKKSFIINSKRRWSTVSTILDIQTDKDFFRLIGYYLSEGGIMNGHYLSFTFNKDGTEFIEDAVILLERYFNKKPIIQKEYNNSISVILCSTIAATFFAEQFGNGAFLKHVPKWAMLEDSLKQAELIKGFWRGDGSFMYKQYAWGKKRMFRINTISKRLAVQIRDMLLRCNIFSSINKATRQGNRHTMYVIYVGGEYLQQFASLIDFKIIIKTGTSRYEYLQMLNLLGTQKLVSYAKITENYAFVPIKSINSKQVSNLPVYNFSVEENESYVAENIVVHNCTAPIYMSSSLHSAVVELVAHKNAHIRYVTIQNWSKNVYNLVTQRAFAYENAHVEWIDGNIGSKLNMKYPSVFLKERGARGEIMSIAVAGPKQVQDSGGKIYHLAPDTTSQIISKSVSSGDGVTTYRGLLHIGKNASNVKSTVRCDALLLDEESKTNTYPYMEVNRDDATITHEASTGKVGEEQLFYLMSRGLSEEEALTTVVLGFLDPLARALPLEYSLELRRLIKLDMSNSVG